jgi:hypothetical protein
MNEQHGESPVCTPLTEALPFHHRRRHARPAHSDPRLSGFLRACRHPRVSTRPPSMAVERLPKVEAVWCPLSRPSGALGEASEDIFSLASKPDSSRPETAFRGDHIDVHLLNGLVVREVWLKPDLRGVFRKLAGT